MDIGGSWGEEDILCGLLEVRLLGNLNFLGLPEQVPDLGGPMPTNISTNSQPDMEKKGTSASPATALASMVLPVPGGPTSTGCL